MSLSRILNSSVWSMSLVWLLFEALLVIPHKRQPHSGPTGGFPGVPPRTGGCCPRTDFSFQFRMQNVLYFHNMALSKISCYSQVQMIHDFRIPEESPVENQPLESPTWVPLASGEKIPEGGDRFVKSWKARAWDSKLQDTKPPGPGVTAHLFMPQFYPPSQPA